tara:strand:+ start:231 stop:488 length:258 start_codon:yes stop_codon:yes gene_type:complete
MPRKINISKYEGNTHYSVYVYDSFNQEHHIGYFKSPNSDISLKVIHDEAEKIWSNEVKRVPSLMSKAIAQCIEIDIKNGMQPSLD